MVSVQSPLNIFMKSLMSSSEPSSPAAWRNASISRLPSFMKVFSKTDSVWRAQRSGGSTPRNTFAAFCSECSCSLMLRYVLAFPHILPPKQPICKLCQRLTGSGQRPAAMSRRERSGINILTAGGGGKKRQGAHAPSHVFGRSSIWPAMRVMSTPSPRALGRSPSSCANPSISWGPTFTPLSRPHRDTFLKKNCFLFFFVPMFFFVLSRCFFVCPDVLFLFTSAKMLRVFRVRGSEGVGGPILAQGPPYSRPGTPLFSPRDPHSRPEGHGGSREQKPLHV